MRAATYRLAGGQIGQLAHEYVDQHLVVVGVEDGRRLRAAEQIDQHLQHRVDVHRRVLQRVHWVLCKTCCGGIRINAFFY